MIKLFNKRYSYSFADKIKDCFEYGGVEFPILIWVNGKYYCLANRQGRSSHNNYYYSEIHNKNVFFGISRRKGSLLYAHLPYKIIKKESKAFRRNYPYFSQNAKNLCSIGV